MKFVDPHNSDDYFMQPDDNDWKHCYTTYNTGVMWYNYICVHTAPMNS